MTHQLTITVELKAFVCPCGHILGQTDGFALYTCSCTIHTRTILSCPECGATRTWKPTGLNGQQMTMLRQELLPRNGNGQH